MGGLRRVLTVFLLHHIAVVHGEEEVVVTHVTVPKFVARGEQVELGCHWDLPRDKLYSLKWYLNDREFFRYMPEEEPSIEVHPLPGVNVNKEASTVERVILTNVQLTSSGKYKCEVIAESPNFHTADKSAPMTVVHIPKEEPRIYGRQHKYHIGDTARLTCVSASSSPPAQLTWFINDKQAPQEYIIDMTDSHSEQGLVETRKGLQFMVSHEHFHKGELKLRCSAKIPGLYYKTQQHSVDVHLSYSVPVMESRDILALSGSSSSSRVGQQQQHVVIVLLLMIAVLEMLMIAALEHTPS